jgi:hypothetical protein
LTAIVRSLIDQPERAAAIRANARRYAEQWNWAAATTRLKDFYQQAMAAPRTRKAKPFLGQVVKKTAIGGIKLFLS